LIDGDKNRKKLANKDEKKPHILVNKKGARYASPSQNVLINFET